jgi:tRNA-dihydrouridine synthase A
MTLDRRFSVAPMQEWTDRHDRYFLRLISARALLYTEMIGAEAVLHGDRERLIGFDPFERPVALQLGGAEPDNLARAAAIGEAFGYDEINLNVGCPSDRVQAGRFGACLMAEPETVAGTVAAMRRATALPVTVKCRIGIDDRDSYPEFLAFIDTVVAAGCHTFIVHARKAVLTGLSPRQNREVPPLRYDYLYRLKAERPELEVVLNGGVRSWDAVEGHLARVDGVMVGREAYQNPYFLAEADRRVWGDDTLPPSRHRVVERYLGYVEDRLAEGVRLNAMTRHILGLFQGVPGARAWRRYLSENAHRPGAGTEVVRQALALVRDPVPSRRSA